MNIDLTEVGKRYVFVKFDSIRIYENDGVKVEFFDNHVLLGTLEPGIKTLKNAALTLAGLAGYFPGFPNDHLGSI